MINDVPIPNDRNEALAERMPVDANIGASSFQLLIRMIGSASEMVFPRKWTGLARCSQTYRTYRYLLRSVQPGFVL